MFVGFKSDQNKPSLILIGVVNMKIPRKTILKAIDRVNAEEAVSKANKDFLTNWLKGGLDGPDDLLKQEILNQKE